MTPLNEEMTEKLRTAAEYVETQKRCYATARVYREDVVREAALTGASYREIAKEAGMSYQRVAQLLTGEKPAALPFEAVVLARCPKCKAKPGAHCVDTRSSFHGARHERLAALIEGKARPGKGEPGPFTTIYCRMILVHGTFPTSRGGLSIDPTTIALEPGQFVGRWTGHKWERFDG